jgi:pilus assembly protein CpaF
MPILGLFSFRPGTGRTFLSVNFGCHLAASLKRPVLLAGLGQESEDLSLHLGCERPVSLAEALQQEQPLQQTLPGPSKILLKVCTLSDDASVGTSLSQASRQFEWVLVDGIDPFQKNWESSLEACSQAWLIEKGDLVGVRRLERGLRLLEASHFARLGLGVTWNQADPSQPLPDFPPLPSHSVPAYPRAVERLAQGLPPALVEPGGSFSKCLAEWARMALTLPKMSVRSLPPRSPKVEPATGNGQETALPSPDGDVSTEEWSGLARRVLSRLLESLNLDNLKLQSSSGTNFRDYWLPQVRQSAEALLALEEASWLGRDERAALCQQLVDHVLGYGPLEEALADAGVSEIMVNAHDQVFLERQGKLAFSNIRFWDDAQVRSVIERIVAPLGRRIDESSPKVDARLPDGSRVNAIIPPLALKGPCLTIRKFPLKRLTLEEMVSGGSLTPQAAGFLQMAVLLRKNLVVSGGTGSGKTTLLNVLSSFIPDGERIITIEDSAELRLQQSHVVSLESRPANLEGQGAVTIRDLVVNSLRMRPDRIVVGECRGGEALDMLQAMNTGHEGSLTTVHANSPRDALGRLETLCLMSEVPLPLKVVRSQIASAVDLLVQAARLKDGSRRITAISEVVGTEGDTVVLQDLFVFRQRGFDGQGRVLGVLESTGIIPQCFHLAREAGIEVDFSLFS